MSAPRTEPGEQTDAATGFQYLRARYYDPATGRFLTRDPLRGTATEPQTHNPYAYALNNPTNRVDPTGMASESSFPFTADCLGFLISILVLSSALFGFSSSTLALIAIGGFAAGLAIDALQQDFAGLGLEVGDFLGSSRFIAPGAIAFGLVVSAFFYSAGTCLAESPEFD